MKFKFKYYVFSFPSQKKKKKPVVWFIADLTLMQSVKADGFFGKMGRQRDGEDLYRENIIIPRH